MQPAEPSTGRSARLALVAFALLGLLAIVAFASKSGIGQASRAKPTPGYVSYAFTAFLIVFVLAIPVAGWGFLLQARERGFERRSFRSRVIQNILTVLVVLAIVSLVVYIRRHHSHLFDKAPLRRPGHITNKHPGARALKYEPRFEWTVFWIAILALAATAAVFLDQRRRRKRRKAVPLIPSTVAEDLAAEMTDAIEDLEAEPDARRAVIAAYARMERVLARHGLRRRPSETPLEYLRRILLALTARTDSVTQLTSLFEQAKFSLHEIDASMKHDAIRALREIRDDLQGAPA